MKQVAESERINLFSCTEALVSPDNSTLLNNNSCMTERSTTFSATTYRNSGSSYDESMQDLSTRSLPKLRTHTIVESESRKQQHYG